MNQKHIYDALNKVLSAEPSETSSAIYGYVQNHKKWTLLNFGRYIKQFEDIFAELNTIIELLNYVPKDSWPARKGAQYIFFPETLKTLHRAFEDQLDGYYDEAIMLVRSTYETILRLAFASCYPTDYESIFFSAPGKRAFNVINFARDNLKLDWDWLYRLLSVVQHSKVYKHAKRFMSKERKAVVLEYESSSNEMATCINMTTFVLAGLFHSVVSLFGEDFEKYEKLKARIERIYLVDGLLLDIIRANPKPKFGKLADDIVRLGSIMIAANKGEGW